MKSHLEYKLEKYTFFALDVLNFYGNILKHFN